MNRKMFWEGKEIMSSITVGEIKLLLEEVPDDYEVIMELNKGNTEMSSVIAMINGFKVVDDYREVRLMNWGHTSSDGWGFYFCND